MPRCGWGRAGVGLVCTQSTARSASHTPLAKPTLDLGALALHEDEEGVAGALGPLGGRLRGALASRRRSGRLGGLGLAGGRLGLGGSGCCSTSSGSRLGGRLGQAKRLGGRLGGGSLLGGCRGMREGSKASKSNTVNLAGGPGHPFTHTAPSTIAQSLPCPAPTRLVRGSHHGSRLSGRGRLGGRLLRCGAPLQRGAEGWRRSKTDHNVWNGCRRLPQATYWAGRQAPRCQHPSASSLPAHLGRLLGHRLKASRGTGEGVGMRSDRLSQCWEVQEGATCGHQAAASTTPPSTHQHVLALEQRQRLLGAGGLGGRHGLQHRLWGGGGLRGGHVGRLGAGALGGSRRLLLGALVGGLRGDQRRLGGQRLLRLSAVGRLVLHLWGRAAGRQRDCGCRLDGREGGRRGDRRVLGGVPQLGAAAQPTSPISASRAASTSSSAAAGSWGGVGARRQA